MCSYYFVIGLTAANNNRIYLRAATSFNQLDAQHFIFYTDNGGLNWRFYDNPIESATNFYNNSLQVDQKNPKILYYSSFNEYRSLDKGATWTNITTPTPNKDMEKASNSNGQFESRNILVTTGISKEALTTNDQGVFFTNKFTTSTQPEFKQINGGLNNSFYYRMDLNPDANKNEWVGATLDNGIHFVTQEKGTLLEVTDARNGSSSHYDKTNSDVQIYRIIGDDKYYYKQGANISSLTFPDGLDWNETDPADWDWRDKLLYTIAERGYFGVLDFNNNVITRTKLDGVANARNYTVSSVKVDPQDSQTIWLGLYNDLLPPVLLRVDGANKLTPTFTDFSIRNMPIGSMIKSISFNGSNAQMDISFSHTLKPNTRIWIYDKNIGSWNNVDGSLPVDRTVNDVLWVNNPSTGGYYLLTATDQGLWITDNIANTATQWQKADDLPNADVKNICYRESDGLLAVSTFGHGVWTCNDLTSLTPNADFSASKTDLSVNEFVTFKNLSTGATDYKWDFGDGTVSSDENPPPKQYQLSGEFKVTLTINSTTNPISTDKTITVSESPYPFTGYDMKWTEMGPFDIGCRATCILYAPNSINPRRAFVTDYYGGIYRTLDYRNGNWKVCGNSNKVAEGTFASVVQDPYNPDILYACSGYTYGEQSNTAMRSRGIYKSTDGGDTWTHLTYTVNHFSVPFRMIMGYNNDLYVAADAFHNHPIYGTTQDGGVYKISLSNELVTKVISCDIGFDIAVNTASKDL